jgi:UDP-N-acetylmuramoylalanine--D-glutamate ligase
VPRPPLPAGPWLVVGLARSGLAAGALLAERGEEVVGVDAGTPALDPPPPFPVHLATDGLAQLGRAAAVVKSPGVPPRAPVVAAARERGLPVLGEVELGWRLLDTTFVAVTGTNGKTTVTEWLGHVLRGAGRDVAVAGNVGTALTSLAGRSRPPEVVVCECSSFQLHDTLAFAPDVAVLTGLGSDHLDWHGSVVAYHDAKRLAFARQTERQVAVLPPGIEMPGAARRVIFREEAGALPGAHNRRNAGAVAAAARALGVRDADVAAGLASFPGVAHRLRELAVVGGVRWVDDSKATNVESALTALEAYAGERVHVVLGGDDAKGEDFTPLRGRAHAAYLIGEAAERLEREVGGRRCGDLASAVAAAREAAQPGDVVLLSPACASYDQYRNFEERGRHFARLVESLR